MDKKEELSNFSVGISPKSLKNVNKSEKWDGWELKSSHLKKLSMILNGQKMVSLTHGTGCINQFLTDLSQEWEIEMSKFY